MDINTVIISSLVVFGHLILFQDVQATTSIPTNRKAIAVVSGDSVRIPCSSTLGSLAITWVYAPTAGSSSSVIVNGNCVSNFPSLYSAIPISSSSSCDLIILNAIPSVAGQYQCNDNNFSPVNTYVTVLDLLGGTQNASYVTGGDTLLISCSLNYSTYTPPVPGFTPIPSFSWYYPTSLSPYVQNIVSSVATGSMLTSSLVLLVPNGPAVIPSVTCLVNFSSTPPSVYYPVTLSWNSSQTIVSYCPVVTVLPTNGQIYQYSLFTCLADAYPPAVSYQWVNNTGMGIPYNQTFNITSVGPYNINCMATNYLFGGRNGACYGTTSVTGTSYASYCPQNVTIYPFTGSSSTEGSTFYCSANATPPVSLYQWTVTISGVSSTYTGQNITVNRAGSYLITCTVTNYLYGSTFYPCTASNSSSGCSTESSTPSLASTTIALAVIVPVAAVLIIIISSIAFYLHFRLKKLSSVTHNRGAPPATEGEYVDVTASSNASSNGAYEHLQNRKGSENEMRTIASNKSVVSEVPNDVHHTYETLHTSY